MKPRQPAGLGARGKKLWSELVIDDMPADQAQLLTETCRVADYLEDLNRIIRGKGVVDLLRAEVEDLDDRGTRVSVTINIDDVLMESRQQQNLFKQLLVTVRQLAPGAAKMPAKGGSRGAHKPAVTGATPIDSARGGSWRAERGA